MIHKIIRFKVHEYAIEMVIKEITEYLKIVRANEPETNYVSYQLDDKVSFLHVISFPDDDAENAHRFATYTAEFVEQLYPRCQEDPVFASADPIMIDGE